MFKRQFRALEHPTPDAIDCSDPKQFRTTILWLEDQKIRHYKIEDRAGLRKFDSEEEWDAAYEVFKKDVGVPESLKSRIEEMAWLLSYATRLEYYDNSGKYRSMTSQKFLAAKGTPKDAPSVKSTNPFDNLDHTSPEFIAGVKKLAEKLEIPQHPDHLITLRAVSRLVQNHLSTAALKEPLLKNAGVPLDEMYGGEVNNPDLEVPIKILRLLQIQSVRQLQTGINETIVAVQNITADPKTDTKLGKVGF